MEQTKRAELASTSVRRRRRLFVALAMALAVLLPMTAACGTGQNAQHLTSAATGRVGDISILDVEFLFDQPVAGDEVYGVGAIAPLAVTIVNHGREADRLVRVSSPIAASGLVIADGLVIPGGRTLTAGQIGPISSIEVPYEDDVGLIALAGLREPIRSGLTYPVVFGFDRAGDVVLDVPVDTPDFPRRDRVDGA